MIAYRYFSEKELNDLVNEGEINGYKFFTNKLISTNEYDRYQRYLHFYLDDDYIFNFDNIIYDFLVTFNFPNEFDKYRGIGTYKNENDIKIRVNQLAIPSREVKKEYIKNISVIDD